MKHVAPLLIAAVAAVLAGPIRADSAPKPRTTPVESGLVEQVLVQLVQVNFLAVDRKGLPVLDLRPDEIEVYESRTKQRVAFLQPYYAREARGAAPAERAPAPPAPTSEPTSDAPPATPAPGRWIMLVFDHYLASQGTKIKSIEAAQKFVDAGVGPGDHVAVISFDGKLKVIQNFTTDRAKLRLACDRALGYVERASEDRYRAIDSLVDQMEQCKGRSNADVCAQRHVDAYEDSRLRDIDAFVTAITLLTRSVSPIPDTKALYLFSEGFPRVPGADAADAAEATLGSEVARYVRPGMRREVEEQFDAITEAAAAGKVSIFTINPGGARRMSSISAAQGAFIDARGNPLQIDLYRRVEVNAQQSLSELAQRTGGVATQGSDIYRELSRLNDLAPALYTVGYYPTEQTLGTEVRNVKIRVLRRGVRTELRRDVPRSPQRPPLSGELVLEPGACSDQGRRPVTLKLRLDRSSLTFTRVGGNVAGNFAIFVRFLADGGTRPVYQDYRFFNVTNTADEAAAGNLPDPAMEQILVVPCGTLSVSVTATDGESGANREFTASLAP
jgi:VWFA-related protein